MHTVEVRLIQDLWLNDLLADVLQGDDAHHLIERVALALVVHSLHNGEVGLACRRALTRSQYHFTQNALFNYLQQQVQTAAHRNYKCRLINNTKKFKKKLFCQNVKAWNNEGGNSFSSFSFSLQNLTASPGFKSAATNLLQEYVNESVFCITLFQSQLFQSCQARVIQNFTNEYHFPISCFIQYVEKDGGMRGKRVKEGALGWPVTL